MEYFSKPPLKQNLKKLVTLIGTVFVFLAIPITVYIGLQNERNTKNVQAASGFPVGFTETPVSSGLSNPAAMEFAPDGRLFVAEQGGSLRIIKNPATSPSLVATPFLSLSVNSSGERGLLGIAFDPNFSFNNYVYLYYTATSPAIHNRISRFTANGDVAVAGSEVVIMDLENLSSATNHNGGAIHFGADGKLYIAVGDNANRANSQVVTNRLGKILRINAVPDNPSTTGVNETIPSDNPASFVTSNGTLTPAGVNRSIWAVGLRNPFTSDIQPGSGKIYINDVGEGTWEEINEGAAGRNFGWGGGCEGSCSDTRFTNPIHSYNHSQGCAITGGTFYNPQNVQFPAEYVGDYFFADFCSGWIRKIEPSNPVTAISFATSVDDPVDLKDGPDGSIYYLARNESGSGYVRRIYYDTTPAPPAVYLWCETERASLTAPMQQGSDSTASGGQYIYTTVNNTTDVPPANTGSGSLNFTVSQAGDYVLWSRLNYASGESNSYWAQIDGNQLFKVGNENDFNNWHWVNWQEGTQSNIIVVNLSAGAHTFRIVGREANAGANAFAKIDKILLTTSTSFTPSGNGDSAESCSASSNQTPTATISTPVVSTSYKYGDVINFSGTGTDPEDGSLAASALRWTVSFFHDDGAPHEHPVLTIASGSTSGSFNTNSIAELSPNVYFVIRLTVTDSQGATNVATRNVVPRKVNVTLATNPSGLQLTLDGPPTKTAPHTFTVVENYPRLIAAAATQTFGGKTYNFVSWSDGGAASHTISVPASNTTYTATYQEAPISTLTFTPIEDASISKTQPTTNFGSTNYLVTDSAPKKTFLIKFNVSGLAGRTVKSVKLRFYCTDPSSFGGNIYLTSGQAGWQEETVTWSTAPATPTQLGAFGAVTAGNYYEVELYPRIQGQGILSLAVSTTLSNGVVYSSKEAITAQVPKLIYTVQ